MSEREDRFFEDIQCQGRQMATRIAQAFPNLSAGLTLNQFDIILSETSHYQDAPIAATVYGNGTSLKQINIDKTRLDEQYARVNDFVSYRDLVGMHVGIGVSMDILFQQAISREGRGTNVAFAMVDYLGSQDAIKDALKGIGQEFATSGYIDLAVEKLLYGKEPDNHERAKAKALSVNAQRLAIGMTLKAESMYGHTRGLAVVDAVREDMRTQVESRAASVALLGFALTRDFNAARHAAAETIVAIRDLPLAIPSSDKEIDEFIHKVQVANIRPEIIGEMAIQDLSGGSSDTIDDKNDRWRLGEDTDRAGDD